MRQIGTVTPERAEAGTPSRLDSAAASALMSHMPPVANKITDVLIPSRVFSSWIETGKARQLRRPLTERERFDLENRRDEVAPAIAPFAKSQEDLVALAVLDMYNGFTSIRGGEDDAAARVDAALRLLAEWPAWAIQKACMSIRRNGVWRVEKGEGKYDKRWPPNESELVDAVRKETRLYSDTYHRCVALLTATVEGVGS